YVVDSGHWALNSPAASCNCESTATISLPCRHVHIILVVCESGNLPAYDSNLVVLRW
ncbi:hypothetical protein LSAT2_001100, partial [Lamellibrachia satsuma]